MLRTSILIATFALAPVAAVAQGGIPSPTGQTDSKSPYATVEDSVRGIRSDVAPRFRNYVLEQRRPSYSYDDSLTVGTTLPDRGWTYYDVPREYGPTEYRYTVVNDRAVLVDPRTRRVIQVIN